MAEKTLLLAFHNHQPDGNFDEVFAQSFADCYGPLVDLLFDFPRVKCALHFTGALLEWIERNAAGYFGKVRALVERGQVEMLGGGFYEPMLAVLPERDAAGQLAMMSDYLLRNLGAKPRGMWLAERVWEPGLPRVIADAGLRFTMLDDGHFRYAGMEGRLRGYYVTEKAGSPLAIFPIDKDLRYSIPFRLAREIIDFIGSLPDGAYTYGDDGEKFGVWPGTKEWVWEKGWLREFFTLLSERTDVVKTMTFSEYVDSHPPTGRVYLPTASYEEMGEWSLPAAAQRRYHDLRHELEQKGMLEWARPYLRGGIWQNFLAKYDEANFMHKKMVYVSQKVADAGDEDARRALYRAQCNCSYWHGLFGGLYLGYLRHRVYSQLIEAEVRADRTTGPRVVRGDFDADLQEELLMESADLNVYVRPAYGGAVSELDDRKKRVNLLNVLARRDEGYHDRLREAAARYGREEGAQPRSIHDLAKVKEPGLERLLVSDRHLRLAFVDHFFAPGTTLDAVAGCTSEDAGDFVGAQYKVVRADGPEVILEREGLAYNRRVRLRKTFVIDRRKLTIAYRIEADEPVEALFAVDLPLFLDTAQHRAAGRAELPGIRELQLHHDWLSMNVTVRFSPEARVWRFPLEAASQSEGGFERTYQGTVFVPVWKVALGRFEPTLEIELSDA